MNALRDAVIRQSRYRLHCQGERERLRSYEPGDDARTIDWRISARARSLHVRVPARGLPLTWSAIVDRSASLTVGRRRPLADSAREAAGLWRASCAPDDRWFELPEPEAWSLARALDGALTHLPPLAVLLVVGDFHELPGIQEELLRALGRRVDCTALVARDPWHAGLPLRGPICIVDIETHRLETLYIGDRERRAYCDAVAGRSTWIQKRLQDSDWRVGWIDECEGRLAVLRTFALA